MSQNQIVPTNRASITSRLGFAFSVYEYLLISVVVVYRIHLIKNVIDLKIFKATIAARFINLLVERSPSAPHHNT